MRTVSRARRASSAGLSAVAVALAAMAFVGLSEGAARADAVMGTIAVGAEPTHVVFSPDGTRAYVANNEAGTVSVINTSIETVIATIPIINASRLAVSPNGLRLYVADDEGSGTISVVDTSANTVIATVPVGKQVTGMALPPSGTVVYVALLIGEVAVLDTDDNTFIDQDTSTAGVIDPILLSGSLGGLAVHPVTGLLYVAVGNSLGLWVVDPVTAPADFVSVDQGPSDVVISPDGTRVYVLCGSAGTVTVIDTATDQVLDQNPDPSLLGIPVGGPGSTAMAMSPDGAELQIVNEGTDTAAVVATASNSVTATYPVGDRPTGVAVRPDGARVYVTLGGGAVSVVSTSANPAVLVAQAPPATATKGKPYSYTFTASGPPAPTFALASGSLPAGLTLNPTSGVLSGTPSATGNSAFTISATNFAGTDTTGPLGITVNAAPAAQTPPTVGSCAGLKATRTGTNGKDVIRGTAGRDVIDGRGGNDVIRGLGGNDVICGGDGNDRIIGAGGADKLYGGRGNDSISGNDGKDRLDGGAGRDELYGGAGKDRLKGGPGRDRERQN